VSFDVRDQLLIRSFAFIRYRRKRNGEHNASVNQLFVDFKKAYDSLRREVFYNIFTELGVPIKISSLNETYSRIRISERLPDYFPIQNGLNQGDALSPLL
jgi:hypothetical protein